MDCELALEVGYPVLDQWDSKTYGMSSLQKSGRVQAMSVLTNASSDFKLKVQNRPM